MKKYIIAALALGAICTVSSCTKGFDDMNVNPQSPTVATPNLLIPDMLTYAFDKDCWEYQVGENLHSNQFAQYVSCSATYFTSDRYGWNDAWVRDGYWQNYYLHVLNNLKNVEAELDEHPEYNSQYQIMRIINAISAARTTDAFGDIPYSEAGTGALQPKYDSQKDIYYSLFTELTEAVDALNANKSDVTQLKYSDADLIYAGDVDKWIKLGNSVRLRLAMRISFKDPQKAKTEAEAAIAAGLMTSTDDNAGVKTVIEGQGFPLLTISTWNEFRASKTIIDQMLNGGAVLDPRCLLHFSQTENYASGKKNAKRFQGLPNGLPAAQLSNLVEYPAYYPYANSCIWGYNSGHTWNVDGADKDVYNTVEKPMDVLNYSEVCFLLAEAALNGYAGAGDAKENYEAGIKASYAEACRNADMTLVEADPDFHTIEEYMAGGEAKWDASASTEKKLEKIITQKWVALYPNGNEAWAEFRRTGYPEMTPVVSSEEPSLPAGTFIKKLRYINDERSMNPNSLDESLNSGKGDGMDVRVWWDTERYN